jgi:hypothetical protein
MNGPTANTATATATAEIDGRTTLRGGGAQIDAGTALSGRRNGTDTNANADADADADHAAVIVVVVIVVVVVVVVCVSDGGSLHRQTAVLSA